jgi:branched-subunit amino acid transport protein
MTRITDLNLEKKTSFPGLSQSFLSFCPCLSQLFLSFFPGLSQLFLSFFQV